MCSRTSTPLMAARPTFLVLSLNFSFDKNICLPGYSTASPPPPPHPNSCFPNKRLLPLFASSALSRDYHLQFSDVTTECCSSPSSYYQKWVYIRWFLRSQILFFLLSLWLRGSLRLWSPSLSNSLPLWLISMFGFVVWMKYQWRKWS